MAQPLQDQSETPETEVENQVRKTAVLLMAATLIFSCVMATFVELSTHSAYMAMSNLPMTALLPFVLWLLGNALLKRFRPHLSLSAAELRMLLCVLWVGGSFAGFNWATMWAGMMMVPRYFASPENRWEELFFDHLPRWMYPLDAPGVVDEFYQGLLRGDHLPWGAWIGPIFWAASIALAITAVGLGLTAIFQKQWAQHERLTYPLAQVTLDLTEGFDRRRGWPAFITSRAFWIGFAVGAVPLLWNLVEYWVPGFPRLAIFDPHWGRTGPRSAQLSRYLPPFAFSYRLLPTLLGFTFLCDLNILFSIWSVYLMGLGAQYAMNRVGFTIGLTGQEADGAAIVGLFSNGAMAGLAFWAIWVARGHLRRIFQQACRLAPGDVSETAILSPRGALAALFGGLFYMLFWLYRAGCDPIAAVLWLVVFWIGVFVSMKLLAASGFAYLFPFWAGGTTTMADLVLGTRGMSNATLVSTRVINVRLLAGWRVPPALPHVSRLMDRARNADWLIWGSIILGLIAAGGYTIWLCYASGGSTFHAWNLEGAARQVYNRVSGIMVDTDRTVPDPGRIAVYVFGGLSAILFTILQARVPWWPLHPMGLIVMYSWYMRLYMLDIFIVWLAKLLILKFGGIQLYRRAKPVCYGLIVGYVLAVGIAILVDVIWFPGEGHHVHAW